MGRKKKHKVERYHDRVARTYDAMYEGSRYWDLYREITWRDLKRYIPRTPRTTGLDAGCGTGLWGLKLARCGLDVTFLDISAAMLDVARDKARSQGLEARCRFQRANLETLEGVDDLSIDLAVAQGDPLSCCDRPASGVASLFRVLKPGGTAVVSVDSLYGGAFFFLERSDVAGLEAFLTTGRTMWETSRSGEQFPIKAFSAANLRSLFERAGFDVRSIVGKPVLPLRRFAKLLDDRATYRRLLALELKMGSQPELLGGAAHLQIAARKPA